MSWTPSVGVVGAGYWSYMAHVLAESLSRAIRDKRVDSSLLPQGIYNDAREFFNRALDDQAQERSPARMNAYVVALDAVWESGDSVRTTDQAQHRLRDYSDLLERLRSEGPLTEIELKTAAELRHFFLNLSQAGDAEAYADRVVRSEPPPMDIMR
jgi:hypothetical protein